MKNMICSIIVLILMFFCIGETKISFNPFYISISALPKAIGTFLVIIGIVLIMYSESRKEYYKGYEDGVKDSIEKLEKDGKEKNN